METQTAAVEATPEAVELTIEALGSRAEEVGERDEAVREMVLIDPELPPEQQLLAMEVYKAYLTNIVAKLKAAGVQVDILMKKPELLPYLVRTKALELMPDEATALLAFEQLMKSQGTMVDAFKKSELWSAILGEGESLFKDPKAKWMGWYEASPKLTMAVSAGVAILGAGLLVKGVKSLFSSDSKEKAAAEKKFFTKGKIAGLGVAGLFAAVLFGREHLIDWAKDVAKGKTLKSLEKEVEKSRPMAKVPEKEGDFSDSIEKCPPSNTLLIGDSISEGLALNAKINRNTDFIGRGGRTSAVVLQNVRDQKEKFANKELAVVNVGGNDAKSGVPPEHILKNIQAIVAECKKAGVKKVIVLTRFPYDPRLREDWGEGEFERVRMTNKAVREKLLAMNKSELDAEVLDLYSPFADKNGYLRDEYWNRPRKNGKTEHLHPFRAYGEAVSRIKSRAGEGVFARRLNAQDAVA